MTPLRASVAGAIASIILILVVVELVRGRRLKERYALLWLATGAVLLILSVWREGLNTLAGWFGVTGYPPAVLFAVATLFIFLVLLHYSTVISRLTDENVDLAQRIALARGAAQPGAATAGGLNAKTSPMRGVVDPVGADADPVGGAGRRRPTSTNVALAHRLEGRLRRSSTTAPDGRRCSRTPRRPAVGAVDAVEDVRAPRSSSSHVSRLPSAVARRAARRLVDRREDELPASSCVRAAGALERRRSGDRGRWHEHGHRGRDDRSSGARPAGDERRAQALSEPPRQRRYEQRDRGEAGAGMQARPA